MPTGLGKLFTRDISLTPRRAGAGRKIRLAAAALAVSVGLSGCAAPVVGALTVGEVLTIAGLGATFMTGRDITEHALSAMTGKDCRMLESVLRSERGFCEEHGAPATRDDFGGVIALLDQDTAQTATALAAAHRPQEGAPADHGFKPIDRQELARSFTLDRSASASRPAKGDRLAFGFLQASYGQTWDYEVTAEKKLQMAEAKTRRPAPKPLPARRADGKVIFPVNR